jgi:hypothetical protein
VVAAELGRELSGIQADFRHREAGTQYMPLASALCLGMRPDVGQWNCAWRRGPVRVTLVTVSRLRIGRTRSRAC